jgi:antitoxin MazE
MTIESDALLLSSAKHRVRAGWAEASRRIAATGEDSLALPDFPNQQDKSLAWQGAGIVEARRDQKMRPVV